MAQVQLLTRGVVLLSEALRLIRVFYDMKQTGLAEKLAISSSYLSETERGLKQVPIGLLSKYADIFRIPSSSILFFSENMDGGFGTSSLAIKARRVISSKVLNILALIEAKAALDGNE